MSSANPNIPLKIRGHHTSTCIQRVKLIAYEKGVDLDIKPVDLAGGENKTLAYLDCQPFGKIPYLDDGGFILFETRAIGRYIAMKYANQGPKLIPDAADLKAVALFEQGASIEMTNFEPSVVGVLIQKLLVPMRGGQTDEVELKKHYDTLKSKLQGYERMLSKHKYLAGEDITAVDLFHLPHAGKLEVAFPDFYDDPSLPNVARWYRDMASRPSWKRVLLESV